MVIIWEHRSCQCINDLPRKKRGRGRGTERERERKRERQTERQTDRQRHTQHFWLFGNKEEDVELVNSQEEKEWETEKERG